MAKMVNATFAQLFTPPAVFWYANVAFTIFAIYIFTPQYLHIGDGHICKEHNYKFVKSSTCVLGLKVYKYVAVHPM